jgi:hypothetical protein
MSNLLYSLSFVGQIRDEHRYFRQKKWLDYYLPLLPALGCQKIIMTDNHSDINALKTFDCMLFDEDKNIIHNGSNKKLEIYRFHQYQDKENKVFKNPFTNCPYWWRGLLYMDKLKDQYSKLIYIDSDAYILTQRIIKYINNLNTGWNTFWSQRHNFPECTIQILCPDEYYRFEYFAVPGYMAHNGSFGEINIPFTNICKQFNGDRWAEYFSDTKQQIYMDYYTQTPNDVIVTLQEKF